MRLQEIPSPPLSNTMISVAYFSPSVCVNVQCTNQHLLIFQRQAATFVCIAAAIELTCEPLALIFQYQLLVGVRGNEQYEVKS